MNNLEMRWLLDSVTAVGWLSEQTLAASMK